MPLSILQSEVTHLGSRLDLIQAAADAPPEVGQIVGGVFTPTIYGLCLVSSGRKALTHLPDAIAVAVQRYEEGKRSLTTLQLKRGCQLNRRATAQLAAALEAEGVVLEPASPSGTARRRWRITDEARHYARVESVADYLDVRAQHGDTAAVSSFLPAARTPWPSPLCNSLLTAGSRWIREIFSSTAPHVAVLVASALLSLILPAQVQDFPQADGLNPIASRCEIGSVSAGEIALRLAGKRRPIDVVLQRSPRCGGEWAELRGRPPAGVAVNLTVVRAVDGFSEAELPGGPPHITSMLGDIVGCVRAEVEISHRGEHALRRTRCL